MIDTKALREKILDLAMRGKLVPQDPNDEPASELLKRIKAEKEQLIKEKKIKRDKNETEIFRGEDKSHYEKFADGTVREVEVPYELPDGWEWARLRHISRIQKFESVKPEAIPDGSWIVELEDVEKETGKLLRKTYKNSVEIKSNKYFFRRGTVLYGKLRPYLQKVVVADADGYSTTEMFPVRLTSEFNPLFLYHYLFDARVRKEINTSTFGVNLPRVRPEFFKNMLTPVPPLAEQTKIVDQLHSCFDKLTSIDMEQDALQKLSAQLKQKVLHVAMQGKLVSQDPSDESASVFLGEIRAQKQRLFEAGKLQKKDLVEMPISSEVREAYGVLPMGWELAPVCAVTKIVMGHSPKSASITDSQIANAVEFHQGKTYFGAESLKISSKYTTEITRLIDVDAVVMSVRAPVGDVNRLTRPIVIGRGLAAFIPYGSNSDFLYRFLQTQKATLELLATGTTFKAIGGEVIRNQLIPLPPLAEQEKITKSIETCFAQISGICQTT